MSGLLEMLTKTMGNTEVDALSNSIGADKGQTQSALSAALPMLISALAKNSQNEQGASALAGALDRDHDGSILDNLSGFLGGGDQTPGESILKHILPGQKREVMQQGIGEMAGLNPAAAGKMITMLAPLVMGYLGKQKREQNLDGGGLASMLGGAREESAQANPQMNMLNMLLDRDGDGSIADDVAGMGMNMLGNLFGGKK